MGANSSCETLPSVHGQTMGLRTTGLTGNRWNSFSTSSNVSSSGSRSSEDASPNASGVLITSNARQDTRKSSSSNAFRPADSAFGRFRWARCVVATKRISRALCLSNFSAGPIEAGASSKATAHRAMYAAWGSFPAQAFFRASGSSSIVKAISMIPLTTFTLAESHAKLNQTLTARTTALNLARSFSWMSRSIRRNAVGCARSMASRIVCRNPSCLWAATSVFSINSQPSGRDDMSSPVTTCGPIEPISCSLRID